MMPSAAFRSGDKTYFFAGGQYIRVTRGETLAGEVDEGYPKPISKWGWGSFGLQVRRANRTSSEVGLGPHLIAADIDGDGVDELVEARHKRLTAFRADDLVPLLEHSFPSPIRRVLAGDFVLEGRERGTQQLLVVLADGSMEFLAISDDRDELWWGATQPSVLDSGDRYLVADLDGDGADELMTHRQDGTVRFFGRRDGLFDERRDIDRGNLDGLDLRGRTFLAGDLATSHAGSTCSW